MKRRWVFRRVLVCLVLALFSTSLCIPTTLAEAPDGVAYLVQPNDTLSQIAERFLGETEAWIDVMEATNARAEQDASFAIIEDPASLVAGQKVWIPGGISSLSTPDLVDPITSIVGSVLYPIVPLPMSDGKAHLVYDLSLTNWTSHPITLDKFRVLDPESGNVIFTQWDQDQIASFLVHREADRSSATLAAGETAILLVDVVVPLDAVPKAVAHEVLFESPIQAADVKIYGQRMDRVEVGGEPAVIGFPFEGDGWITFELLTSFGNDPVTPSHHRTSVIAIDNQLMVPQRFGIDWMRVDEEGNLCSGDPTRLEDYAGYGTPLLAVADGIVVEVKTGCPDSPLPFDEAAAAELTLETLAGNHVLLDIGNGLYVLYGHLKPGSVTVQPGDEVVRGQVLGQLGHSGNSTAPHLHFHVMDRPSISGLGGQGVAYVFDSFEDSEIGLPAEGEDGAPSDVGRIEKHQNQMPINMSIINVGELPPNE